MDDATLARFWSKVNKDGPVPAHAPDLGPCWMWSACVVQRYGQFSLPGSERRRWRRVRSHRFAYETEHGPVPEGRWVLHRCDNPLCVRPSHLFLGTHQDNMDDMAAKGRRAIGEEHGMRTTPEQRPRGERNGSARVDAAQVRRIRARYAAGESQSGIARSLGLHSTTVQCIVRRKTWKHVE